MTVEFEVQMGESQLKEESFNVVSKRLLRPEELNPATAEARFIEPITATIAVASVALLAERIVTHWLRSKEQGVEIDLRKKPALISRIAGTPMGFVMVIKPDGETQLMQVDYDNHSNLADVIQSITKLFGGD
ncbi:hypothetical protein [Kaarinaea lacus]